MILRTITLCSDIDVLLLLHPSHGLAVQELIQALGSIKPTEPALLHTTMRQRELIMNCHGVDVNSPRVQSICHSKRSAEILGVDRCCQSVLGVVGKLNHLIFCFIGIP